MRVDDYFHLTYCSSIHPGESWPQVSRALAESLPRIRTQLGVEGPMAIGLRLSAQAAADLDHQATLSDFQEFLTAGNYYVPTITGFPYGAFHGQRVKEQVYLPDWRHPERLAYTNRLAGLLARLLANRPEIEGSVSTVPGAFRAAVRSDAEVIAIAAAILEHSAFLVSLRARTGVTITLALEPEPKCLMEKVDDIVAFFGAHLFDAAAVATVATRTGTPLTVEDVRRHVGICFDTCHMAVEFEDPAESVRRLCNAGIRILKVQLSSALQLGPGMKRAALVSALAPFADDTYFHQVVQRGPSGIVSYTDLPEALAAADDEGREWRVHFHVPIFLSDMTGFQTTQPFLESLLDVLRSERVCQCLEVETYTWDVLPPEYRTSDVCTAIARELQWVRSRLEA